MKKICVALILLMGIAGFAELPIPTTAFHKAPLGTVETYAGEGRAEAQLELALRYYAGHQVSKNAETAFLWMSKSAEQNDPRALELLSQMYADGLGTPVDAQKAEFYFIRALVATPEEPRLIEKFNQRVVRTQKSGGAEEFIKKCADTGYGPAYISIYFPTATNLYMNGNYEEVLPLLVELSNRGDSASTCYLAQMYEAGLGNLPQDDVEAFVLYQQAAKGGNGRAQCKLAEFYDAGKGTAPDSEQAESWYRQAAEQGDVEAQYRFAEFEFTAAIAAEIRVADATEDDARFKKEYTQRMRNAIRWYKAAADQMCPEAQYMLGRLYASGEGVDPGFEKAVQWYEAAAAQGHAESSFYLGLMYHSGLGIAKDIPKAISLYETAAGKGSIGALYYLGNCYRFGLGVSKNPIKGEGIYYGKILKAVFPGAHNKSELTSFPSDPWAYATAREYSIILWKKASTRETFVAAAGWAGISSQNGDPLAGDISRQMDEKTAQRYLAEERGRYDLELKESPVEPKTDAVARRRIVGTFPYAVRSLVGVYEKSSVQQRITLATVRSGYSKNTAGDDLTELFVKYRAPAKKMAMDYNGIVLMGVEFEDSKTRETYWAFGESRMPSVSYTEGAYMDVSMVMDTSSYSNVKTTRWAVLYGHLLPDGTTVAVFDERGSSNSSGNVVELFMKNRYAKRLAADVVLSIDLAAATVGSAPESEGSSWIPGIF